MLKVYLIVTFFEDIKTGFDVFREAFRFIHRHKWYWFALLPAIFMVLLYRLGHWISTHELDLTAHSSNGITWIVLYGFIEIGLGLALMDFTKYLIVIVLSPLLTYLSAATERKITGKKQLFSLQQFIHDVKRAVRLALRNMMWQYAILAILFFIGTLIWGKVIHSPVIYIMYVTSFFYYGFSFMDYTLERQKLSIYESVIFVRKHRVLTLLIGASYSLLILVPVNLDILFSLDGFHSIDFWLQLGEFAWHVCLLIAASFAPILGIVMATLAAMKMNSSRK
jgi:CysZ protein